MEQEANEYGDDDFEQEEHDDLDQKEYGKEEEQDPQKEQVEPEEQEEEGKIENKQDDILENQSSIKQSPQTMKKPQQSPIQNIDQGDKKLMNKKVDQKEKEKENGEEQEEEEQQDEDEENKEKENNEQDNKELENQEEQDKEEDNQEEDKKDEDDKQDNDKEQNNQEDQSKIEENEEKDDRNQEQLGDQNQLDQNLQLEANKSGKIPIGLNKPPPSGKASNQKNTVQKANIIKKPINQKVVVVSKPPPTIKDSPGPSQTQKMVSQLTKNFKEREKGFKELDEKIYVQEEVEKRQPKENKPRLKQSLVFKKDVKEKLDDPTKTNQEKAQLLIQDLAQKVNKKVPLKEFVPQKIEIQQPEKNTEPKPRKNLNDFNLAIGAGIKSKLQTDAESEHKSTQVKERNAMKAQKEIEKKKAILQMAQYDEIKIKEKEMARKGEDNLKKENKILQTPDKVKDKKVSDVQYEDNQKEQSLQEEQIKKQLLVQLRHLKEESQALQNALKLEQDKNTTLDAEITVFKKTAKIVDVGGKFTSFGLAPILQTSNKKGQDSISIVDKNQEESQEENSNSIDETLLAIKGADIKLSELTIAEIIVNKIAVLGLSLQEVYHMLDNDGDGVLTMTEIRANIKVLNLKLTEAECEKFISLLDQNSDGVLSEPEFYTALTSSLDAQKEFVVIMGDLKDIANPIILDERKLDLQFRKKLILKKTEHEIKKLEKNQTKYDSVVKILKETEMKVQIIKGVPADRVVYLKGMELECDQLRKVVLSQQEQRQKITKETEEKSELMEENIKQLTNDLTEKSVIVLETKQQLKRSIIEYQKKEHKNVAYSKLNEKFKIEMKGKAVLDQDLKQKTIVHQENKQRNLENGIARQKQVQQIANSVWIIQKLIRGKLTRSKLKKKLDESDKQSDRMQDVDPKDINP